MQLEGTILDGISPEHRDCTVIIEDGHITVSTSTFQELNWKPADIQSVKSQNGQIRITILHEQDKGNDPVMILKHTDETLKELEYLTGKRLRPMGGMLVIPLALGGLVATVALIFMLVNHIWRFIPSEVDISLGKQLKPSLLQQMGGQVVEHRRMQNFLENGIEKLKNPNSPFEYEITIFDHPMENAFALPGGQMFISSELIRSSETPEEILGILAHEIAHVEKRHGMQNISRAAGVLFVITTSVGIVGGLEEFEMAEAIVELVAILPMMHYSRKMETEADEIALRKLHRERISAQGIHDFFARMTDGHMGEVEEKIPDWLSSHPASNKRMIMFKQHIDAEPHYQPVMSRESWKALKSSHDN